MYFKSINFGYVNRCARQRHQIIVSLKYFNNMEIIEDTDNKICGKEQPKYAPSTSIHFLFGT